MVPFQINLYPLSVASESGVVLGAAHDVRAVVHGFIFNRMKILLFLRNYARIWQRCFIAVSNLFSQSFKYNHSTVRDKSFCSLERRTQIYLHHILRQVRIIQKQTISTLFVQIVCLHIDIIYLCSWFDVDWATLLWKWQCRAKNCRISHTFLS